MITELEAEKMGRIPCGPVIAAVQRWCLEKDSTVSQFEEIAGLGSGSLLKIAKGTYKWIHFDFADRVITFIDPWLWHIDPDLREVYENFDFGHLDLNRPPSLKADELPLLDCLSSRLAAAVMGVGVKAVQSRRAVLREELAA